MYTCTIRAAHTYIFYTCTCVCQHSVLSTYVIVAAVRTVHLRNYCIPEVLQIVIYIIIFIYMLAQNRIPGSTITLPARQYMPPPSSQLPRDSPVLISLWTSERRSTMRTKINKDNNVVIEQTQNISGVAALSTAASLYCTYSHSTIKRSN